MSNNTELLSRSFVIIVQFATCAAQTADASRVVFAFARDEAIPGSRWWKQISKRTQTPIYAVAFVAVCAAFLGLLGLNQQAGLALFAVAVISLYVSYAIPIFLRLTSGRDALKPVRPSPAPIPASFADQRFEQGPFSLGSFGIPIGIVAVAWVVSLPLFLPASPDTPPTEKKKRAAAEETATTSSTESILITLPAGIHPRHPTLSRRVVPERSRGEFLHQRPLRLLR